MNLQSLQNLYQGFALSKLNNANQRCLIIIGPTNAGKKTFAALLSGDQLLLKQDQSAIPFMVMIPKNKKEYYENIRGIQFSFNNNQLTLKITIAGSIVLDINYRKNYIFDAIFIQYCLKQFNNKISIILTIPLSTYNSTTDLISLLEQFTIFFQQSSLKNVSHVLTVVLTLGQQDKMDTLQGYLNEIKQNQSNEKILYLANLLTSQHGRIIQFEQKNYLQDSNKEIIQNILKNSKYQFDQNQNKLFTFGLDIDSNILDNLENGSLRYLGDTIKLLRACLDFYRSKQQEQQKKYFNQIKNILTKLQFKINPRLNNLKKLDFNSLQKLQYKNLDNFQEIKIFLEHVIINLKSIDNNQQFCDKLQFVINFNLICLKTITNTIDKSQNYKYLSKLKQYCLNLLEGPTINSIQQEIKKFKQDFNKQPQQQKINLCVKKIRQLSKNNNKNKQIIHYIIKDLINLFRQKIMYKQCIQCMIYCNNYLQIGTFLKEGVQKRFIGLKYLRQLFKKLLQVNQFQLAFKCSNYLIFLARSDQEFRKMNKKILKIEQKKKQKRQGIQGRQEPKRQSSGIFLHWLN